MEKCIFACLFAALAVQKAGSSAICPSKGDSERNRNAMAKELLSGSYARMVVWSDGELPILALVRAASAVTAVADVLLEVVQEQVSKGQSLGNRLCDVAVKELRAKIMTLRHAVEVGMERQVPVDVSAETREQNGFGNPMTRMSLFSEYADQELEHLTMQSAPLTRSRQGVLQVGAEGEGRSLGCGVVACRKNSYFRTAQGQAPWHE